MREMSKSPSSFAQKSPNTYRNIMKCEMNDIDQIFCVIRTCHDSLGLVVSMLTQVKNELVLFQLSFVYKNNIEINVLISPHLNNNRNSQNSSFNG